MEILFSAIIHLFVSFFFFFIEIQKKNVLILKKLHKFS